MIVDLLLPQSTSLVILDISRNQLVEISEGLGKLSNLVELNLSRNRLTKLPECMFNSKNMINLSLHSIAVSGRVRDTSTQEAIEINRLE